MYASVRHYTEVKSVKEVCGRIEHSFVPLLRTTPGFIAYYAIDGGNGEMVTVSVFSTRQMAEDSNERAAKWLHEHAEDLQPHAPEIISGRAEVVATA